MRSSRHGHNKSDREVLADAGWTESLNFPRYYRDPINGRLFKRHEAALIQRSRDRTKGVKLTAGHPRTGSASA